jgi:hypothetical protein
MKNIEEVMNLLTKEKVELVLKNSFSYRELFRYFDIKINSHSYIVLNRILKEYNFSINDLNKIENKPGFIR